MKEYIASKGKPGKTTEYFCFDCGQLRLSLTNDKDNCLNCGNDNIKHAEPGTLDKEALKRQFWSKFQRNQNERSKK